MNSTVLNPNNLSLFYPLLAILLWLLDIVLSSKKNTPALAHSYGNTAQINRQSLSLCFLDRSQEDNGEDEGNGKKSDETEGVPGY